MPLFFVRSDEEVSNLISRIENVDILGFDTETTGLDPFSSKILLYQFCVENAVFVCDARSIGIEKSKSIFQTLKESNKKLVGHNIGFDIKMIYTNYGIELTNVHDTMITEVMLTAGLGNSFISLADIVLKYFNQTLEKDTRKEFFNLPDDTPISMEMVTYAGTDVIYLCDAYQKQLLKVEADHMLDVYKLEMELVPVISRMELNGIYLDSVQWAELTEKAIARGLELEAQIKEFFISSIDFTEDTNALDTANKFLIPVRLKRDQKALQLITNSDMVKAWIRENINLASSQQLRRCLSLVGIDTPDTNEKTLKKLPKSDIIELILLLREQNKMISSFGYNIIDQINKVTGKLHTSYNNIGTATGRLSSSNPNLQQVPVKDEYRSAFMASPGYSLIDMDYSQQEYRLVGAVSGEPRIIDAYISGKDMHLATASIMSGKSIEDVTKEERNFGKTLNFAILYGTTDYGLKYNLQISMTRATEIIDTFYAGYPKLSAFKQAAEDKIVELGYSVTPLGRRRYFKPKPAFSDIDETIKYFNRLKREGFNMIIQGGGADITKIAMLNLAKQNPFGDKFRLLLQVHDELVVEAEDSILDEAVKYMKEVMEAAEQPFLGRIPAAVDYKVSKRWSK